jgi:hypothetical protein
VAVVEGGGTNELVVVFNDKAQSLSTLSNVMRQVAFRREAKNKRQLDPVTVYFEIGCNDKDKATFPKTTATTTVRFVDNSKPQSGFLGGIVDGPAKDQKKDSR